MLNYARSFRGLLLLSGLILTVHTLVPHVHGEHFPVQGETRIIPKQEAPTSWLDMLTKLVDTDMGEDHLEHFSPEKTVDFILVVPTISPLPSPGMFAERFLFQPETATGRIDQYHVQGPKIEAVHLCGITMRGPPVIA